MKRWERAAVSAFALLATALPAAGREILTPEEEEARSLDERRSAAPVLSCTPASLTAELKQGQTSVAQLSVRNAGGRRLRWSVLSSPGWTRLDQMSGELGFEESRNVVVVIDASSLPPGPNEGQIVIVASEAQGSPATISVSVGVEELKKPPSETTTVAPQPAPVPRKGRTGRFGLRTGVMAPGSGDIQFTSGPFFGLFVRSVRKEKSKVSVELGFNVSSTKDEEPELTRQVFSSTLLAGRFDLLLGPGKNASKARPYFLLGFSGIVELLQDEIMEESYTNMAGALNVGGGVTLLGGRLDFRVSHDVLMGSENVGGLTLASVAFAF
jgi:hypothetical protein